MSVPASTVGSRKNSKDNANPTYASGSRHGKTSSASSPITVL